MRENELSRSTGLELGRRSKKRRKIIQRICDTVFNKITSKEIQNIHVSQYTLYSVVVYIICYSV